MIWNERCKEIQPRKPLDVSDKQLKNYLYEDGLGQNEFEIARNVFILTDMSVKAPHLNELNQETLVSRTSLAKSDLGKSLLAGEGDLMIADHMDAIKIETVPADFNYGPPIELDGKKTVQELMTYQQNQI